MGHSILLVGAGVDDRAPERRRATLEFWPRLGEYDVAISERTVDELQAIDFSHRAKL